MSRIVDLDANSDTCPKANKRKRILLLTALSRGIEDVWDTWIRHVWTGPLSLLNDEQNYGPKKHSVFFLESTCQPWDIPRSPFGLRSPYFYWRGLPFKHVIFRAFCQFWIDFEMAPGNHPLVLCSSCIVFRLHGKV